MDAVSSNLKTEQPQQAAEELSPEALLIAESVQAVIQSITSTLNPSMTFAKLSEHSAHLKEDLDACDDKTKNIYTSLFSCVLEHIKNQSPQIGLILGMINLQTINKIQVEYNPENKEPAMLWLGSHVLPAAKEFVKKLQELKLC